MSADNLGSLPDGLSAQDRQRLDSWVYAFEQGWDERRWALAVSRLPADEPLRRPTLVEIAKIDMARRRDKGQSVAIDFYLEAVPELAANGLPSISSAATDWQLPGPFESGAEAATPTGQRPAILQRPTVPPAETPGEPAPAEHRAADSLPVDVQSTPIGFSTPPAEPARRRSRSSSEGVRAAASTHAARPSAWKWVVAILLVMGAATGTAIWRRGGAPPTPGLTPNSADANSAGPLGPDDLIRTISVKLAVGNGADLTDRVGLDLGLGFPLWLAPIGTDPTRPAPFGAMPQHGPADPILKAGAEATFMFATDGDRGQDVLHTTQQLLGGVRVKDIRRVGFVGPVTSAWEFAGYEVKINDRTVAADSTAVSPRKLLDKSFAELADVGRKMRPREQTWIDLRQMVEARLATQVEYREQKDLRAVMAPDAQLRERLEARLQGKAPWLIVDYADLPTPAEAAPIKSARVTVLTRAHEGADTRNYVYAAFGAAKYLIGSPDRPLTPMAGLQSFDLDLDTTPIPLGGTGGCALGMLAHSDPQGDVPDRWHPERLIVSFDGKIELDSDRLDRDRRSLNAIRLVPPAQINWAGMARDTHRGPREVSVWEFGGGAGLNVDLRPLSFSTAADPTPPQPELGAVLARAGPGQPAPTGTELVEGMLGFPGEVRMVVPPLEAERPGEPYSSVIEAAPVGRSFQVRDVRITDGMRVDDRFTVNWGLAGDESAVDHYEVSLVRVRPENSPPGSAAPLYGDQYALNNNVPPGIRTITATPTGLADSAFDPLLTLRPLVRAVPVDAAGHRTNERFGAARVIYPRAPTRPQLSLIALYWRGRTDSPPVAPPVAPALPNVFTLGRPTGAGTTAWQAGQIECNGVIYAGDGTTPNVSMLLDDPAEQACVWLRSGVLPPITRPMHVAADVGFADGSPGQVEVRMSYFASPPGPAALTSGPWQTIAAPAVVPMTVEIPPQAAASTITVRFDIRKSTGGPSSRPTLFGVRLAEKP